MPLVDNAWYVNFGDGSTTGYYAVTQWAALTTRNAGALVRQLATPAVGSERVFVLIVGAVASGASEPAWVITRGGKTSGDGTETWLEATGIAALNGDLTNTPTWATVKNTAIVQGQVIQNVAGTLILICSVAGTAGNGAEPSWAAYTNAGATTADNTVTWITLGASFSAWAAPHARLANSFAANWGQAGNKFFVGDNHAETQSTALTLTSPGTVNSPAFVYDVDHTVAVPPTTLKTTASITTTGTSAITFGGFSYYNGFIINNSTGAGSNNLQIGGGSTWSKFENCAFNQVSTAAGSLIVLGNTSTALDLINCTVKFGSTGQNLLVKGYVLWRNTSSAIAGTNFPTQLFNSQFAAQHNTTLIGVDLSALLSTTTLVASTNVNGVFNFIDCKLGSAVIVAATPAGQYYATTDVIRADSGATNYRHERYRYQGTQKVETTVVRTGGASDGTTPISWSIVSSANSKWVTSFESMPIAIWNNTTGSHQVTIYGTTTGGGVPNNDDIWIEVEYLGTAGNPQASFQSTTKANNLAASTTTNNSSDASTWGGGGAGNGFKMVTPAFTVNQVGWLSVTVKVAKASSTYYIDPLIVVS